MGAGATGRERKRTQVPAPGGCPSTWRKRMSEKGLKGGQARALPSAGSSLRWWDEQPCGPRHWFPGKWTHYVSSVMCEPGGHWGRVGGACFQKAHRHLSEEGD